MIYIAQESGKRWMRNTHDIVINENMACVLQFTNEP